MSLVTLRGYLFDELGNGVGDIEVSAHAKNSDGTWVGTPAATTSSSSTTGKWEIINLDTADAPQTGVFGIRIENPATGQVRRIEGDVRMMFGQVIGANGSAPLANGSVLAAHIADGVVSDTKLGNRTVDDTNTLASDTGTPTQLWSRLANMVKQITGESSWRTAPDTTLVATAAHIANTSNPHSTTAAQVGAATSDHTHAGSNAFGTIAVSGSSNVVADQANDTATFIAGSGMDITTSAGSDSITFTVDETELNGSLIPGIGSELDSDYSICADLNLTTSDQTVDSFVGVPAGTYLVFATLAGESGETDGGTFRLVADGVTQTPVGRINSAPGGGFVATMQWIATTSTSGDLVLTARENASPMSISINDTYSSFGYVRLA